MVAPAIGKVHLDPNCSGIRHRPDSHKGFDQHQRDPSRRFLVHRPELCEPHGHHAPVRQRRRRQPPCTGAVGPFTWNSG